MQPVLAPDGEGDRRRRWRLSRTALGHALMRALALALGLDPAHFAERYTGDTFVLFRIFHDPAETGPQAERWGVGEHTDSGVLTILKQDDAGGLEVRTRAGWLVRRRRFAARSSATSATCWTA